MFNAPLYLCRASHILAACNHFIFWLKYRMVAYWAFIREIIGFCISRSLLMHYFHYFWNHISSPLDQNRVTNSYIFPVNFILVVKCGIGNYDTSYRYWFQSSYRSNSSGASYAGFNIEYFGGDLLSFQFTSNGPTG